MSACFPDSGEVGWRTDAAEVQLVSAGSSVEIEYAGLDADAFVEMLGGGGRPVFWSWGIVEIAADVAFGLWTETANMLYCADGSLVVNDVVVRTGPALKAGDSLVLYIDPEAGWGCFLLNGVAV